MEIAGFFAAVFAWGNRTTIIRKTLELMKKMDNAPYDFILHHTVNDRKRLLNFVHRTFNDTDLLWMVKVLQEHYSMHSSMEQAFFPVKDHRDPDAVRQGLIRFRELFFGDPDAPARTQKHISSPERNSGCKRLNMYLRWMVRRDNRGVDFGYWKNISPGQLIMPVDLHVARVAKRFGLTDRKQPDWKAAEELTDYFRQIDPKDPVRFDFALFGLGVIEKF